MATFITRSEGCYAGPLMDGLWSIYNGQSSSISIKRISVSPTATPNANGQASISLQYGEFTATGNERLIEYVNPVAGGSQGILSGLYLAPAEFITSNENAITAMPSPVSFVSYGSAGGFTSTPLPRAGGMRTSIGFESILPVEGIAVSFSNPLGFVCRGCLAPFVAMIQVTCKHNSGTETAIFMAPIYSRADGLPVAVLKPSLPMSVVKVEFFDVQSEFQVSSSLAPQFRLVRAAPVRGATGRPVALNPVSTYPSLVEVAVNYPFVVGRGLTQRDGLASHVAQTLQLEHQVGNLRGMVAIVQDATTMTWHSRDRVVFEAYDNDSSIVLLPGEALALAAGNLGRLENSPFLTMDVECVFDFSPPVAVVGQRHHVIGSSIVGRYS
jgi:hypothetical protein